MILLFEEYQYTNADDIALIKQCVDEAYLTEGSQWIKVDCVGYFYCTNHNVNDAVFVLPKVFITQVGNEKEEWAFGKLPPEELLKLNSFSDKSLDQEKETLFELSAWLYQAIARYAAKNPDTDIVKRSNVQEVKSAKGEKNQTYIDIVLQLQKFQKEHRHLFTYISIINRSGSNKINWNKTVRRVQPFLQEGTPIYMDFYNKTKSINFDEELIVLFYSTLRYLQKKMRFNIVCDLRYELIPVRKLESMIAHAQGTRRLRTIRKKYFTDELVALWNLLYVFFDKAEQIASGRYHQEKMIAVKFNIIFEAMIDQLVGGNDATEDLLKLKNQKDGKRLDHLYKDASLLNNTGEIYFIGDSKYYKESTDLSANSVYKQFTYAKNIIQYHIDIFNENRQYPDRLQYRDELTEGYNITPNFFIRASVIKETQEEGGDTNYELYSYTEDGLVNESDKDGEISQNKLSNRHFENRLFDRDTFVLQTYNINFLYVLAHFVHGPDSSIQKHIREKFRTDLLKRFNLLYDFWILTTKKIDLQNAIDKHFRRINGKVFCPYPEEEEPLLYLALEKTNVAEEEKHEEKEDLMLYSKKSEDLSLVELLEEDFDVYKLENLGDDPQEVIKRERACRCKKHAYEYYQNRYELAAEPESSYNNAVYLIGCYKNTEHKNWIATNKLYNVRLDNRRGAVKKEDELVATARYLVLYNFEDPKEYTVHSLDKVQWVYKQQDMIKKKYPNPEGKKYLLYKIENVVLKDVDVQSILTSKEVHKGAYLEGAPIYVYESDMTTR